MRRTSASSEGAVRKGWPLGFATAPARCGRASIRLPAVRGARRLLVGLRDRDKGAGQGRVKHTCNHHRGELPSNVRVVHSRLRDRAHPALARRRGHLQSVDRRTTVLAYLGAAAMYQLEMNRDTGTPLESSELDRKRVAAILAHEILSGPRDLLLATASATEPDRDPGTTQCLAPHRGTAIVPITPQLVAAISDFWADSTWQCLEGLHLDTRVRGSSLVLSPEERLPIVESDQELLLEIEREITLQMKPRSRRRVTVRATSARRARPRIVMDDQ